MACSQYMSRIFGRMAGLSSPSDYPTLPGPDNPTQILSNDYTSSPTVIFRWGAIKSPLLPPWAVKHSLSLTSIVDLELLALVLDSSHDSCIFLREKSEEI